jgi:hypothetical protein
MANRRIEAEETDTIHRIVKGMPWPPDIKGYDIEFGQDWEGDPAVRVWFLVDDDVQPSDEKVKRVGRFTNAVERSLIDADLSHWPFVRLRALHPARA